MNKLNIVCIIVIMGCYKTILAEEWPLPEFVNVITPVSEKCIEKVGIDKSVVAAARNGVLPDDENLKQYLLCVFKTFDWISTEHHDFEYWKILGILPKSMKKTVFNMGKGCLHIKGQDYAKASLEFVTCLHKHDAEHFSFLF